MPLSLIITFCGFVFWLSTTFAEIKTATATIEKVQVQQDRYSATLQEISQRLSRIEGKLEARNKDR